PAESEETRDAVADAADSIEHEEEGGAVLVGYGAAGAVKSRRRRGGEPPLGGAAQAGGARGGATQSPIPVADAAPVIAKPPIRKLAKDLGVDLTQVSGTGIAGEILRDDVVRQATQASLFRNISTPEVSEAREERIPLKGVRKMTAQAM